MPKREWEFLSDLHDGNIGVNARRNIKRLFSQLQDNADGRTVRVRLRVSVVRRSRSLPQNRYYWGVVVEGCRLGMEEQWGRDVDPEEAHETLKRECNGRDLVNENTGEVIRAGQSTASLPTLEFEDYLDRCRKWIEEWFGVRIPLPNEQLSIDIADNQEQTSNDES